MGVTGWEAKGQEFCRETKSRAHKAKGLRGGFTDASASTRSGHRLEKTAPSSFPRYLYVMEEKVALQQDPQ